MLCTRFRMPRKGVLQNVGKVGDEHKGGERGGWGGRGGCTLLGMACRPEPPGKEIEKKVTDEGVNGVYSERWVRVRVLLTERLLRLIASNIGDIRRGCKIIERYRVPQQ